MAYTGTGTQSDPFVVTTFADFLACVAQEGVYVEVGADIDAAAEGFGYIEPIAVRSTNVYADSMKKISNVTIEGNAVFEFVYQPSSAEKSIQRLHLENWTWKATSTPAVSSHVTIMFYSNFGEPTIRYCKMSVSATASVSSTALRLKSRVATADCAFVIDMHNAANFVPCTDNNAADAFSNTTVSIDGTGTSKWAASTSAANRWQYCTNVGVVLKNMEVTGAPGFNNGEGFSYMVFEDCQVPSTFTVQGQKESNLICFAGTTDASGVTVSSGTVVTQSQLKDKSYLQQISWLP